MYREYKLSLMREVDEITRANKVPVPDLMDKKQFIDILLKLFNEPNGSLFYSRYRNDGEQVSLDLFQ